MTSKKLQKPAYRLTDMWDHSRLSPAVRKQFYAIKRATKNELKQRSKREGTKND